MKQVEDLAFTQVPKIFVVCDRPDTAPVWRYILQQQGLSVIFETSLEKALNRWSAEVPDLVVIDVDGPQQDTVEVCSKLRAVNVTPILLLLPTHHETFILDAYAAGVDEVIVKPISPAVFQAKIMAWARRSWTVPVQGLNLIHSGRQRLDPAKRCLINSEGKEIKLTNLEFRLLHFLMSRPGEILDADVLIQSIWGEYGNGDHVLLKNVIYRLRKKIEADPSHPVLLLTQPGGYSFMG